MTDNEIIKALECCGSEKGNLCTLCPKLKKLGDNCNESDLFNDALDLIIRQKAEIEDLKMINSTHKIKVVQIREIVIKEFAERLKKEYSIYPINSLLDVSRLVGTIDNLVKEMTENEEKG